MASRDRPRRISVIVWPPTLPARAPTTMAGGQSTQQIALAMMPRPHPDAGQAMEFADLAASPFDQGSVDQLRRRGLHRQFKGVPVGARLGEHPVHGHRDVDSGQLHFSSGRTIETRNPSRTAC